MDDASWFRPTLDTWAGHAPAWLALDPALPKTPKTPDIIRGPRDKCSHEPRREAGD
jgi:hypothetical protein